MSKSTEIPILHKRTCGLCCTKIENFGITRGRTEILQDVNLHVHCGELTALIGPNGGGKSTLLKAILGEIPHTGQLNFTNPVGSRAGRPLIGYVPQRLDFDNGSPISVLDLFMASQTRKPIWLTRSKGWKKHTLQRLELVEASHLLNKTLGDLSGGELQRVLLALALDPVPDLLLLDEPISGIDQQGIEVFYNLVSDVRKHFDLSIILVSHDLSSIWQYADRIVLLNKTIQCQGRPEEVLHNKELCKLFGQVWLDEGAPNHHQEQSSGGVRH